MKKKSLCIWGLVALTVFLGGCSCARQNVTGNATDESAMSQDSNYSGETDRTEGTQNETEGSQTGNTQGQTEPQQEQSNIESEESQSEYSEDRIPASVITQYWSDRELSNPEEVYPGFRITVGKNGDNTYFPVWYHDKAGLTIWEQGGQFVLKTVTAEKKLEHRFLIRDNMREAINGTRLAVDDFTGNGKPELMIRYWYGTSPTLTTPGESIQHIEFYDLETLSSYEIDTGYEEALQKEYGLDLNYIKSDWDNGIHMYYRITDDPYERYLHIKLTFSEEDQKFVYDGKPLGAETVK